MEPAQSRHETPALAFKGKEEEELETFEKAHEVAMKKKNLRNKQKVLDKDAMADSTVKSNDGAIVVPGEEELAAHDTEDFSKTKITKSKINENGKCDEVVEECGLEHKVEVIVENGTSEKTGNCEENEKDESNAKDSTTGSDEIIQAEIVNKNNEDKRNSSGELEIVETESSAKNSNLKEAGEDHGFGDSRTEINGISDLHDNVQNAREGEAVEAIEIPANGSDEDSFYETVEMAKEVTASPDAGKQADNSFTHKISSFLGKWQSQPSSPSKKNKQDAEISSTAITVSEKMDGNNSGVSHPYLSKVTGRRGIKTRVNVNGLEKETPRNKGTNLSDSFRVKTDPPRLNQAEIGLESVLKKYRGKRCLNINDDDYYDEDGGGGGEENGCGNGNGNDIYPTSTKRRKLDEKTSGAGFLGNVLWSPFKKRSDEKAVTQSKLSRFLSPFWFWKKSIAYRERE